MTYCHRHIKEGDTRHPDLSSAMGSQIGEFQVLESITCRNLSNITGFLENLNLPKS